MSTVRETLERVKKELQIKNAELQSQIVANNAEIANCNATLKFLEQRGSSLKDASDKETIGKDLIIKYATHDKVTDSRSIKWKEITLSALKREKHVLKTSRILKISFPDIDETTKKKYLLNLSASLHGLCSTGVVRSVHSGGKGYLYGLPEWFEGDKLKKEHRPMVFNFSKVAFQPEEETVG